MKIEKSLIYKLTVEILLIYFMVDASIAEGDMEIWGMVFLVGTICIGFYEGSVVLKLKKSIVGLCNFKKKKFFVKMYAYKLLPYVPVLAMDIWLGIHMEYVVVIITLLYLVLNFWLIGIVVKEEIFTAVFIGDCMVMILLVLASYK